MEFQKNLKKDFKTPKPDPDQEEVMFTSLRVNFCPQLSMIIQRRSPSQSEQEEKNPIFVSFS